MLHERFGNGLDGVIGRDVLGQPASVQIYKVGAPIPGGPMHYDVSSIARNAYGAITTVSDTDGEGLDHNAAFTYDLAGRLTAASLGVGVSEHDFTYQYDGLQNMIARTASGPRDIGVLAGAYQYDPVKKRQLVACTSPTRACMALCTTPPGA